METEHDFMCRLMQTFNKYSAKVLFIDLALIVTTTLLLIFTIIQL